MPTSLAILYPGCIAYEIMLAVELLGRTGRVRFATPDGRTHRCESGMTIAADSDFAAADSHVTAVLIPGGDPASVIENSALASLLKNAASYETSLAAICAGPLLLAKAGLLQGRRFTHGYGWVACFRGTLRKHAYAEYREIMAPNQNIHFPQGEIIARKQESSSALDGCGRRAGRGFGLGCRRPLRAAGDKVPEE